MAGRPLVVLGDEDDVKMLPMATAAAGRSGADTQQTRALAGERLARPERRNPRPPIMMASSSSDDSDVNLRCTAGLPRGSIVDSAAHASAVTGYFGAM